MSHQFKPGDPALIVGAFKLTENIGKVVELVQLVTDGELYVAPNGVTYEHCDDPCWVVVGDGVVGWSDDGAVFDNFGLSVPNHLMPLRGDFAPEQQKAREAEPCA
jgi:hypothetical protein